METFRAVVGHHTTPELHDHLHEVERAGGLVRLVVARRHLGRRRFRVTGSDGRDYGVALDRDEDLRDGSVLYVDDGRAVVVHAEETDVLRLRAVTTAGGVQLGWHAGHLHWRVRTDGDLVTVLLDGPAEECTARILRWLDSGDIEVVA